MKDKINKFIRNYVVNRPTKHDDSERIIKKIIKRFSRDYGTCIVLENIFSLRKTVRLNNEAIRKYAKKYKLTEILFNLSLKEEEAWISSKKI